MSATDPPISLARQALQLLQQRQPVEAALALLDRVAEDDPDIRMAQHLRGVCAARSGDHGRAVGLYIDAIRRGDRDISTYINLASAAGKCGVPDEAVAVLLDTVRRVPREQTFEFTQKMLNALGFFGRTMTPAKEAVFEKLVMPLLETLLERRQMHDALQVEIIIYDAYAKIIETEAHFAAVVGRLEPMFTKSGHDWRAELPPLHEPSREGPCKVGFFVHNASMLAHIEVLLNALKGYRMLDVQPFQPTVYCFGGRSAAFEQALADLDVPLVILDEVYPDTERSHWARLLRLRERLGQDGVRQLVWISAVVKLPLAFGMRMAPVQTWWAMKYRNFSQPDIDGYLSGSALTRYGTFSGRRFRTTMLGVDDWYDPRAEEKAAEIRADFGDKVVLMSLARTEKMGDPAYLSAIVDILRAHPQAIFMWAGRAGESQWVADAFEAAGVLDQTHYIGWVNTRLYAQVGDILLDTFPFPGGFTVFQAMAAGKPVVLYDSPEASEIGVWSFIRPLTEGEDGTPEERAELQALVGGADAPLISIARSPEDYVRLTARLIQNERARRAAGEASKAMIDRYFSDPRTLGRSMSDHLVELMDSHGDEAP